MVIIRDALKTQYNTEFELAAPAPAAALLALEAGQVKGAILEEPFVALALLAKDAAGKPKYKTIFGGTSDANGDGAIDANLAGFAPPAGRSTPTPISSRHGQET